MASCSVDQVTDWLTVNGFGRYVKNFKDEDINGAAMIGLTTNEIRQLLTISDRGETIRNPTKAIQRKFRTVLEEYKTSAMQEKKKQRRSSSSIAPPKTDTPSADNAPAYTSVYAVEKNAISWKFFQNEMICTTLKQYFLKKFNIIVSIPSPDLYDVAGALQIKLIGVRQNVKSARDELYLLFGTIQIKTFSNETTDKRVIKWSKSIYSDSALIILQKIFLDKKKWTVWEKTSLLSGYYTVYYLTGQHEFSLSEEFICQILKNEVMFVKDIIIPNMNNIQTRFRKALDEFIKEKGEQQQKSQTMAIIYCQYPFQTEMKISFFGLRNAVDIAKRKIKSLINKHRMRTIRMELDLSQREYLLDNCVSQLKTIESDYEDDNVKIQIRENSLTAPQYLLAKIKERIESMAIHTKTLIFQSLGEAFTLTEKDHFQLKNLARCYNCEIVQIVTETRNEFLLLPQRETVSTSKYLIEVSNEFYSSLLIPRKLKLSNKTIEICTSMASPVDITIISATTDAIREKIDPELGNGYFESDTGKKVLFIEWLPSHSKKSVHKFITLSLQQIDALCAKSVQTIVFATTNWETYDRIKQLSEDILNELKEQLQTKTYSDHTWNIVFHFDEEQKKLYDEFSKSILALIAEKKDFEEFLYPISVTTISLKASNRSTLLSCGYAMKQSLKTATHTAIEIDRPFNDKIWDQHMINTYYKYCLEHWVYPKIYLFAQPYCLNLVGPVNNVNEAKEKYRLMEEIERHRLPPPTTVPSSDRQSSTSRSHIKKNATDSYNIILNCCLDDRMMIDPLANRLTRDRFRILIDYSDKTLLNAKFKTNESDLILICFSWNYSENHDCMTAMLSLKQSRQNILPIVFLSSSKDQNNNWFQNMATEELFYESFEQKIKFKIIGDLGLEYDKLSLELLHYTKPGFFGRIYPKSIDNSNKDEEEEEREKNVSRSIVLLQLTPEEIEEKQQAYEKQIRVIVERDRISDDDLRKLKESLEEVLNDFINGRYEPEPEEQEFEESISSNETKEEQHSNTENDKVAGGGNDWIAFQSSLRRWLEKASVSPMIEGNLPPFTLSGDFNDAVFPIPLTDKAPWWKVNLHLDCFDHSSSEFDLNPPELIIGSWCNSDEAHLYFQKLIDKDIIARDDRAKRLSIKKPNNNATEHAPTTEMLYPLIRKYNKRCVTVWDDAAKREVLREYERRQNGRRLKKSKQSDSGWDRLMDRSVKLLVGIRDGEITMNSNEVEGNIGRELKTHEEMGKRRELDNPNNKMWIPEQVPLRIRDFVQMKIKNIIEWEGFLGRSNETVEVK